jgi:two-component system phosphate regulon sensor histidine kinase PhoR
MNIANINIGKVPLRKLFRGALLFSFAPILIVSGFWVNGYIETTLGLYTLGAIFILSLIFSYPYLANLSELTKYVNNLADDIKAQSPDLTFLNNVEELSEAVKKLNNSWERRKKYLEALILEDKILINSLPDMLIMLNSKLEIIEINKVVKDVFGEDSCTDIIKDILLDPNIFKSTEAVLKTGNGANLNYTHPAPFNKTYIVKIEKFPINSPNNIAIIIVMHDVTKQKETERMLSDFVANASHEIRTPLASISGFIETMQDVKSDKKTTKKFLGIMKEQASRIEKLVRDLLTLSKVESGVNTEDYDDVDAKDLVKSVKENLENYIKDKKIKFKTILPEEKILVRGNYDELYQVIDNLVLNAIKYSPNGSTVTVEASLENNENLKIKKFRKKQYIARISIIDNGEGIEKKYIPRLTERFFRIDKARSRKIGGSGLGLAIVKYIIDNHNGILDIKSELGKGSNFTVYLPV